MGLLLLAATQQAQQVGSDGIQYYAYFRTVVFDRDLDLRNDYGLLGWQDQPPVLPIGAPLLWSPLLGAIHGVRKLAGFAGLGEPSGVEPIYQAGACLASWAYGALGLVLLHGVLRRWVSPWAGFWTVLLAWFGSPLRFYLDVLPAFAHAAEFFASVLVLRTYLSLRERPDARRALGAGLACGLAFLTRSQDALLLALPGFALLMRLATSSPRRATVRLGAFLVVGFLLAASPQLLVWQITFGTPILVPHTAIHGSTFWHARPELLGSLISPRGGVFASYPILLVAVVALVAQARRDWRYVAGLLPVLLGMWYVNASVFDWYHVRRFTGLVPLLAPALALVVARLARAGPVTMALLAFLTLRFDLAVDSLRKIPGDPAPTQAVVRALSDGLAADAYRLAEPWLPYAAVRGLESYTGEALLKESVSEIDFRGDPTILRLPIPARHVSGVEVEDGRRCRWVTEQDVRLFVPVARPSEVVVSVTARALETLETQAVELTWNDRAAERLSMTPEWRTYRFHVPWDAVRAGTNAMVLRFDRGPIYRRMRGEGPKEVRPAAIETITFHRAESRSER